MGVLYSPSDPGKNIRAALEFKQYDTAEYWLGVALCFSVSAELLSSQYGVCCELFASQFHFRQQIFFSVTGMSPKCSIRLTTHSNVLIERWLWLEALVANFTAMAVFSSLSKENAPVGKLSSTLYFEFPRMLSHTLTNSNFDEP